MGAVADEKTDNTAAVQKALDAAGKAGGGIVELPAGRYRINGTLVVPACRDTPGHLSRAAHGRARRKRSPTARSSWPTRGGARSRDRRSCRLAGRNSAVAGLVVSYPEWKQSDVPPVPYPSCVGIA